METNQRTLLSRSKIFATRILLFASVLGMFLSIYFIPLALLLIAVHALCLNIEHRLEDRERVIYSIAGPLLPFLPLLLLGSAWDNARIFEFLVSTSLAYAFLFPLTLLVSKWLVPKLHWLIFCTFWIGVICTIYLVTTECTFEGTVPHYLNVFFWNSLLVSTTISYTVTRMTKCSFDSIPGRGITTLCLSGVLFSLLPSLNYALEENEIFQTKGNVLHLRYSLHPLAILSHKDPVIVRTALGIYAVHPRSLNKHDSYEKGEVTLHYRLGRLGFPIPLYISRSDMSLM